jgi:hypothetical protein
VDLNLQDDPAGPLESGRLATSSEGPSQASATASTRLPVYNNYTLSKIKSYRRAHTAVSTIHVPPQPEIGMDSRSVRDMA